ncbi:MAG: AraC family transcriptional regulator [Bacteroidetes bacterium]|nr:AraC family transcriptional regulator [Bacteroidota bacterium]
MKYNTSLLKPVRNLKELFSIQTLEQFIYSDGQENKGAKLNSCFEIIWILKGSGTVSIDLMIHEIDPNRIYFIKPGQAYRLHPTTNMEGYIISFAKSFLDIDEQNSNLTNYNSLFKMFSNLTTLIVNADMTIEFTEIIEKMNKEFLNGRLFRNEILKRYLKIFIIYLTRQFEDNFEFVPRSRNEKLVQDFFSLVEKKYLAQKMVSEYAGDLAVTPNYLNEIVKKITGKSAGYHIRQRVVMEAKRQVIYSGSCMKEIAYYLGFCDLSHFSKFFKNTTGMNFTDFKKERIVISISSSVAV